MTDDVAAALRELLDREQIRDLIADYSFHIDHGDYAEVVGLFAEDCVVSYGPGMGPTLRSRAELAAFFDAASADEGSGFVNTSHHNADVRVALEPPDHANGTVSLYAWHGAADGSAAQLWGYYYDRYRRTSAGWKIVERELKVCGEENFAVGWTRIERSQTPK
jgi:ketosteroid isomerase-like protein